MKKFWIVLAVIAVIAVTYSLHATTYSASRQLTPPTPSIPSQKFAITTVFWVGEAGNGDNEYISNASSAWDENWMVHFGGVDDPTQRYGFSPKKFTPKENPFYVALPYYDIDENGARKLTARLCPNAKKPGLQHYSWCKNSWIAVAAKGKTAYAQWEDVGPYQENDVQYVFGTGQQPINKIDSKAGLDVSPAIRDYLKLKDVDKTSWQFVDATKVPKGPWKTTTTTSLGDSLD